MSAFIVSEDHINVIVSFFVTPVMDDRLWLKVNGNYGYMDGETVQAVAEILYNENVRSVNHRYNDSEGNESYEFEYVPRARQKYNVAEIAGALDCLEYQSCESDDYRQTQAFDIITMMRKHLLKMVQTEQLGDETVWEISERKMEVGI